MDSHGPAKAGLFSPWAFSLPPLLLALLLMPRAQAQAPTAAAHAQAAQGLEELQHGNFGAAEAHFSRALALDPGLADVRVNLGLAYYADHKYDQASQAYQEAIKQQPALRRDAEPFLGLSLSAAGRCTEALPILKREFATNPDLKLRRVLGLSLQRCLLEARAAAEADQVTQQLLAQYPGDVDVLYEAGQMYGRLSSELYLRLMKVAPHSARAHQVMGELASSEGRWQPAIDAYQEAIRLDPNLAGAHFHLGLLLLEHSTEPNAWKMAIDEFNAELKIDPTSGAEVAYEIGVAYRRHGEPAQAIAGFRKALDLNPGFVEARLGLAKALREEKNTQEALDVLIPALHTEPQNAFVHFLLAQIYRDLNRLADAQREQATFEKLNSGIR